MKPMDLIIFLLFILNPSFSADAFGDEFRNLNGKTYYQILQVHAKTPAAEMKSSFRKLIKIVHQDKGGNDDDTRNLIEAYNILLNPAKRERYDAWLSRTAPELIWLERRLTGASRQELRSEAFDHIIAEFDARKALLTSQGYILSENHWAFEAYEIFKGNSSLFEWSEIRNLDLYAFLTDYAFERASFRGNPNILALAGAVIVILRERTMTGSPSFASEARMLIKYRLPDLLKRLSLEAESSQDQLYIESIRRYLSANVKLIRGTDRAACPALLM